MHKLAKLLETSLIKSLRFNLHYFGWGGGTAPRSYCKKLCVKRAGWRSKHRQSEARVYSTRLLFGRHL